MPRVKAWAGYDLHTTLAPSFVRAVFERRGDVYVKIAGKDEGAIIYQEGETVIGDGCSLEELSYWSGVWMGRRPLEEGAPYLAAAHRELGLSINPFDKHLIFVAVFLSRATSWETNVLRWCRSIFSEADALEEMLQLDFRRFGNSFQLRLLAGALKEYASIGHENDVWTLRRKLVSIKHVGPKIADAYLLFTGLDVSSAPVDRHAIRMARRLGIVGEPPKKNLCSKYSCESCPLSGSCLRYELTKRYGQIAGWVQTAFYLHDATYCSKRACEGCVLNAHCAEQRARTRRFEPASR